ncbi:AAA family ATPase [Treponema sp.]|uniref:AAA family ATPase n=1 Tax=Treponema sp. TaxID=166 RepID=UPI00298E7596|nr:AAA family ATPase [Treponema sp.]MCQ2242241.1 AAA family ATPase [Treponema sp.]
MSIEQNIIDAVEISKMSRIPVLFMSNPGLGKTTILKRYAARYGYHLETLIGSRFTPEEISGYQVNNGGDHLQHMNPEWFNRILEMSKQGKRTLLFVDELSTCSEFVQGALLSLIFDRTIGNEKFLPKDCFIIAAANYAKNLPSSMNMMAPTLNRFIIINLNENYNALDMMDEFLNPPKPPKYPSKVMAINEKQVANFRSNFQEIWKEIFIKYSDPTSALGILDIENHVLDGLYSDSEKSVYNFISGRSLSYLFRTMLCYVSLGISNLDLLNKMVDGLVGAGTCLFKNEVQARKYRMFVQSSMASLVFVPNEDSSKFLKMENDLSKDSANIITNLDNPGYKTNDAYCQILHYAKEIETYFSPNSLFLNCQNPKEIAKFISAYEAMGELRKKISSNPYFANYTKQILNKEYEYYGYYCAFTKTVCNYARHFGLMSSDITNVVFIKDTNSRVPNYYCTVLRKNYSQSTYYEVKDGELLSDFNIRNANVFKNSPELRVIAYSNKKLQLVGLNAFASGSY